MACDSDEMKVLSSDLVWVPQEDQAVLLEGSTIGPVDGNILIAKMRRGQRIKLEARAEKGIGKVHAKWSPVATASYRLLPKIEIKQHIAGTEAEELVSKCPMNVFDIEDLGGGKKRAVVSRPRDCTMCRECVRTPPLSTKILLSREPNHFIFQVESTGILSPQELFTEAVKILMLKCSKLSQALKQEESKEMNNANSNNK